MRHLFTMLVLVTFFGCSDNDPCAPMLEAAEDNLGRACLGSGDCTSIPCACADGSTVDTTSCSNNACGGIEACEDVCGEVLAECSGGGGSGGGGTCCTYECESGGAVYSGSTSSATDQGSCQAAADAFCEGTAPTSCVTLLNEQCSFDTCDCSDADDNGGSCPAP